MSFHKETYFDLVSPGKGRAVCAQRSCLPHYKALAHKIRTNGRYPPIFPLCYLRISDACFHHNLIHQPSLVRNHSPSICALCKIIWFQMQHLHPKSIHSFLWLRCQLSRSFITCAYSKMLFQNPSIHTSTAFFL